jgi:hypothetical protein
VTSSGRGLEKRSKQMHLMQAKCTGCKRDALDGNQAMGVRFYCIAGASSLDKSVSPSRRAQQKERKSGVEHV